MYTRNSVLSIIAGIFLTAGCPLLVFAQPVLIYGGDFDIPIPAESDSTKGWMKAAVIDVKDHYIIYDLDVVISLEHTKVFDLQLFLQSPAGTGICLNQYNLSEYFDGEDYAQTIFDDQADTPIEQAHAPFTGRFRPKAGNFLSDFNGQDTFGLWQLQVYDAFYDHTGVLNRFELVVTVPEPATVFFLTPGLIFLFLFRRRRF